MGYLSEERETHLYYDPVDKRWKAWTNMPEWGRKLLRCGWKLIESNTVAGEEVDWTFVINDPTAITVRDMTKPKRTLSPEMARQMRETAEMRKVNTASDTFIDEE